MKLVSWLILLSSSILYVLPFWFSGSCWWLVFLFPVPLFYVVLKEQVSFTEGFAWGLCTYSLHMIGILQGTMALAQGHWSVRIIPSICIILYASLYAGIWFLYMHYMHRRYISHYHMYCSVAAWVASLSLYTLWFDQYFLFVFDRCEGYMLLHPLLPLAEQAAFLQLLPYTGKFVLTVALYSFAGCVALLISKPTTILWQALAISLLPWMVSILVWASTPTEHTPTWLSHIGCIQRQFPNIENHSITACTLREEVRHIVHKNPTIELIVIPESSVYSCHLLTTPSLAAHLGPEHVGRPLQLLIGSFYEDQEHYRNSCYWLKDGIVQSRFDKRHAMVMIERVPRLLQGTLLKNMYFTTMPQIIASTNARPCLPISNELCIVPYLCSELFFNEYPDDNHGSTPILLMANDSWCPLQYPRHLMYLAVKLRAIQWQRDIIYISYHYAAVCSRYGNVYIINRNPL